MRAEALRGIDLYVRIPQKFTIDGRHQEWCARKMLTEIIAG